MTKYDSLLNGLLTAENKLVKLSSWIQTMEFIILSLDNEDFCAKESPEKAMKFARKYSGYSESLFLIQDGLKDCGQELSSIIDTLQGQLGDIWNEHDK